MTVLSRIFINPQTRHGRKLLANRQAMHAAVMASFPPDALENTDQRVLWRLDRAQHRYTLYVLSPLPPDFTHLVEQAGWIGQTWDSTDYRPFLEQLKTGQQWAFRLTANPVKALREAGKRGKVVPHVTPQQQVAWLDQRAGRLGFRILPTPGFEDQLDATVTEGRNHRFGRNDRNNTGKRNRVALRIVQFDGRLEITDAAQFQHGLLAGIGRAKAYGCGLLTLRR
ncbi:type I-E CRISPR-associated protein Cas6/Cse3/CasE [Yaniella flava]|uniref:Type I-E CRISPR-associated protein Cas6/Cse3/CasE n=1 Tax=Yaniella flava TaxID=287930 RepID=A0ABN2UXQ7_9MICC